MAWEVYSGKRLAPTEASVSISALGRLHLNKKASELFQPLTLKGIDLMFNSQTGQIAVKPTGREDAFSLKFLSGNNGAGLSCVAFLNHIGYDWSVSRVFPAKWVHNTGLVFTVSKEHLGHKPINRAQQMKARSKEKKVSEETS